MNISTEVYEIIRCNTESKEYPKKFTFLQQGQISRNAYYIESGCIRLWYNNNGDDISVKFFLAGDLVASLDSFYLKEPSKFGIESIIPSVVRTAERSVFQKLYDNSPNFKDQMLLISVYCMRDYQDLFLNRIMNNPERRYQELVYKNPRLLEIIPQHYLASYLGITPVSLSRIRKKFSSN